jgi:hypothetical protein
MTEQNKAKLHDKVIDLQSKFTPDSTQYAICQDVIEDLEDKKVTEPYAPEFKDNFERLEAIAT